MPYRPGAARPLLAAVTAALFLAPLSDVGHAQPSDDFVPVTDATLDSPAPADWLSWRRTPDGWGYSPLDQIDRGNVGELRMAWSRGLTAGSQEGTPLAYDGVLYMPNPGDVIQAIDAVTGDLVSSPGSPGAGTVRRRQTSAPVVASWAVMTQASGPPRGMQLRPETTFPPAMMGPDECRAGFVR